MCQALKSVLTPLQSRPKAEKRVQVSTRVDKYLLKNNSLECVLDTVQDMLKHLVQPIGSASKTGESSKKKRKTKAKSKPTSVAVIFSEGSDSGEIKKVVVTIAATALISS